MFNLTRIADALSGPIPDPLGGGFSSLSEVFGFVLNTIIYVGWAFVFYTLALGFTGIATSGSNPDNAKKNKNKIIFAIVGGVMLFFVAVFKENIPILLGIDSASTGSVPIF